MRKSAAILFSFLLVAGFFYLGLSKTNALVCVEADDGVGRCVINPNYPTSGQQDCGRFSDADTCNATGKECMWVESCPEQERADGGEDAVYAQGRSSGIPRQQEFAPEPFPSISEFLDPTTRSGGPGRSGAKVTIFTPRNNGFVKGIIPFTALVDPYAPLTPITTTYFSHLYVPGHPRFGYDEKTFTLGINSPPGSKIWTKPTLNTTERPDGKYWLFVSAQSNGVFVGSNAEHTVTVDNYKPVVTVTEPADNAALSGQTRIKFDVNDVNTVNTVDGKPQSSGINTIRVDLYVDDKLVKNIKYGTERPPHPSKKSYSFLWNTASITNGRYALRATAYDRAGNMGVSRDVAVTVKNLPVVTFISPPTPLANSYLKGTISEVRVKAISKEPGGVIVKVEFCPFSPSLSPRKDWCLFVETIPSIFPDIYSFYSLDTKQYGRDGTKIFKAKAYDSAGNVGEAIISWIFDNTPPSVAITSPVENQMYRDKIDIKIAASDRIKLADRKAAELTISDPDDIQIFNKVFNQPPAPPFTHLFDSYNANGGEGIDGNYSFEAIARDAAGNTSAVSALIRINNLPRIRFPRVDTRYNSSRGLASAYLVDFSGLARGSVVMAVDGSRRALCDQPIAGARYSLECPFAVNLRCPVNARKSSTFTFNATDVTGLKNSLSIRGPKLCP